jgi:LemA protein
MSILWIVLGILLLLLFWFIGVFNGIVVLRNRTKEAWSDIDVQLKRRYDLIPNLIETVKGYAKHEDSVFTKVTEARTAAIAAEKTGSTKESAQAENMLSGALKSVFAVAESYPDLKASDNFKKLQDELTDTENKIEASRRFYNGNVRDFNTKIQLFPNNIAAGILNAKEFDSFEAGESEKVAPEVKF